MSQPQQPQQPAKKQEEQLPKEIWVKWVGESMVNIHNGRSTYARRNPYFFEKNTWVHVVFPEDVAFFYKKFYKKSGKFKVRVTPP